jgi:hypothetical protein
VLQTVFRDRATNRSAAPSRRPILPPTRFGSIDMSARTTHRSGDTVRQTTNLSIGTLRDA